MEYPFVIGTAGHIDHGKTRLVKALTGVSCDSLSEEMKRGITIELGFAPLHLPSGRVVSIVDVPGHERFIRQMVAGVAGVDAVMLVVAADEGVMPQTREHLDILSLLGVDAGFVVLSKSDLVDAEMLELAKSDVESVIEGTFLESSPIVITSAETGDGMGEVARIIDEMIGDIRPKDRSGAFFMPIDRAFGMKGFGSVVTGTIYCGSLEEGDEVEVMPSAVRTKVRSIQVHGESSEVAVAGQRTAVNLASVSLDNLKRGDALCAPARFSPTDCFDAEMRILPSSREGLSHWQRVRVHVGTSDVVARVSLLHSKDGDGGKMRGIEPGGSGIVQMLPESPIVVAAGQRFVVRFYSPLVTIGGGRVLLPHAHRPGSHSERLRKERVLSALSADFSPLSLLEAIVNEREMLNERELLSLSQMDAGDFTSCSKLLGEREGASGISIFGTNPKFYISEKAVSNIAEAMASSLGAFHSAHPELAGLDADELHSALSGEYSRALPNLKDFKELLKLLVSRKLIRENLLDGNIRYSAPNFEARGDDGLLSLADRLVKTADAAGFEMTDVPALQALLGASPADINRAIGYLKEKEGLRVIGENLVLTRNTAEKIRELVARLDEITIGSMRDAMGTSRKYALAALEFLDSTGMTRRVGDKRVLLKR